MIQKSSIVCLFVLQVLALCHPIAANDAGVAVFQIDANQHSRIAKGKDALYDLQRRTETAPTALSMCWSEALRALTQGCRSMSDEDRSKFAVQMANCHLQRSGIPPYACTSEMSLLECTADMARNPIAFNAYTEFMLHADNICYFLQNEYFLERTEGTINKLAHSAEEMLSLVEGLSQLQEISATMANSIEASVEVQRQVLRSQSTLEKSMTHMQQTQEQHLTHITSQFTALGELSDNIHQGVEATIRSQEELASNQVKLGEQQERLHQEGKAFLEKLTVNGDLLNEKMESSLVTQQRLQEAQESAAANLEGLAQHQNELLSFQEHFFIQQSKMHEYTKESLGDIIDTSNEANGKLRALVETQSELFGTTLQSMSELASRSEDTISRINQQQEEISRFQGELYANVASVQEFQKAVMGEFFDIKAVVYYAAFIAVGFVLTASPRTGHARLYLSIMLILNMFVERVVFSMQITVGSYDSFDQVWMIRKAFCLLGVLSWFVACVMHHDYQRENNTLLQRIASMNDRILQHQRHQEELWRDVLFNIEARRGNNNHNNYHPHWKEGRED